MNISSVKNTHEQQLTSHPEWQDIIKRYGETDGVSGLSDQEKIAIFNEINQKRTIKANAGGKIEEITIGETDTYVTQAEIDAFIWQKVGIYAMQAEKIASIRQNNPTAKADELHEYITTETKLRSLSGVGSIYIVKYNLWQLIRDYALEEKTPDNASNNGMTLEDFKKAL